MKMKRTPKKCDVCGNIFSTMFCSDCGRNYDEIEVNLPVEITTYVHGSKSDGLELCREYGVDPETDLGEKLIYLNYEVKLVYEIIDNKPILKKVNAGDGQGLCEVVPIKT